MGVVLLASQAAVAGTWTKQTVQAENVLMLAASADTKVVGTGSTKDSQGNDQMVWVRTTDGTTWSCDAIQTPSAGEMLILNDLRCLGAACFAVGLGVNQQTMAFNYRVMLSKDGGTTFAYPAPPYNGTYQNTRWVLVDDKNVMLVGGQAVVLKSTDGGSTFKWMVPKVGTTQFKKITDGSFLDASRGWLVNGSVQSDSSTGAVTSIDAVGALLKTTDGGTTWTSLFQDQAIEPTRVKFTSDLVGWMIVQTTATTQVLRRTTDGGATWTDVTLPQATSGKAPDTIDGIWAFNDQAAIVMVSGKVSDKVYWNAVYRTKDGVTFAQETVGDGSGAFATITCASQKLCWVGGGGGLLFRFDGTDDDVVGPTGGDTSGADAVGGDESAVEIPADRELPAGAVCFANEYSCVSTKRLQCAADGKSASVVEDCATGGQVCVAGQCVAGGSGGGGGGCNASPVATGALSLLLLGGALLVLRRRVG